MFTLTSKNPSASTNISKRTEGKNYFFFFYYHVCDGKDKHGRSRPTILYSSRISTTAWFFFCCVLQSLNIIHPRKIAITKTKLVKFSHTYLFTPVENVLIAVYYLEFQFDREQPYLTEFFSKIYQLFHGIEVD